jgi:hypothetical protein
VGLLVGALRRRHADILNNRIMVGLRRMTLAIGGTAGLLALGYGVAATYGSIEIQQHLTAGSEVLTVHSDRGWQSTRVEVNNGDSLSIDYETGNWTIKKGVVPPSDADGRPATSAATLTCACGEPLTGASRQALIGRIGSGQPFLVGNQRELTASEAGLLYLRMNDSDASLGAHDGSIDVLIAISASPSRR